MPHPHNEIVMTVLFRLAEWHALAKLRLHMESTLTSLANATTMVGRNLRKFRQVTCAAFNTELLPREKAAQARRKQRKNARTDEETPGTSRTPSMKKYFNLFIYKFHALGDYVRTICLFGTTDSYTTQIIRVCLHATTLKGLWSPMTG